MYQRPGLFLTLPCVDCFYIDSHVKHHIYPHLAKTSFQTLHLVFIMVCNVRTCIFCKHFQPLYTIRCISLTRLPPKPPLRNFNPSHVHSKCRLITGSRVSLKRTCFAGQTYEIPSKYSNIASFHGAWPETFPGHSAICEWKMLDTFMNL